MHAIIWEYRVPPNRQALFEEHYGPSGTWSQFFQRAPGFRGTSLLRDGSGLYITIDYWESAGHFDAFLSGAREEYDEIDRRCESLTRFEHRIGRFTTAE